jgi:hypothetical protein
MTFLKQFLDIKSYLNDEAYILADITRNRITAGYRFDFHHNENGKYVFVCTDCKYKHPQKITIAYVHDRVDIDFPPNSSLMINMNGVYELSLARQIKLKLYNNDRYIKTINILDEDIHL